MDALLIVDVQNDFLPQGALPVPHGDEVVPAINKLQEVFDIVIAVQDWHPPGHGSFASTYDKQPGDVIDLDGLPQILWPDHCVQGTKGAEFALGLDLHKVKMTFQKGVDRRIDSYGGFYDNGWRRETGLETYLKENRITHIYIAGLTTDYCVKYTALDGVSLGFQVTVVIDGCRAVNIRPVDQERAIEQMKDSGVRILTLDEVLAERKTLSCEPLP